jgi:hypothetical protein
MVTEAACGIVASYAAAWDAHDEGERRALLERAWTDDGGRLKRIVGFFGPFPPG